MRRLWRSSRHTDIVIYLPLICASRMRSPLEQIAYIRQMCYTSITMTKDTTHTRIRKDTLQNLRRIYAETGEQMIEIMHRLVQAELKRLRDDNLQIQAVSEQKESNTDQQD